MDWEIDKLRQEEAAMPSNPFKRVMMGPDGPVADGGLRAGVKEPGGRIRTGAGPLMSRGEFNAGSKREMIQQIGYLMAMVQQGEAEERTEITAEQRRELVQERRHELIAAWSDKSGQEMMRLGETLVEETVLVRDREGFARRFMGIKDTGKGEDGRIPIQDKTTVAWQVMTDANTVAAYSRALFLYPKEFYLTCLLLMEEKDILQSPDDRLERKFQECLEATMVKEDILFRTLSVNAAPTFNNIVYYTTLSPLAFSTLRSEVSHWPLPCAGCVIAWDIWDDIIADTDFSNWFDPVTKHELVLEGNLGSILGVPIVTDGFRYPTLRVLQDGECFFYTAPGNLGCITRRQEIVGEPVNQHVLGKPNKGWFFVGIEGMQIVNSRGVAWGRRL